MQTQRSRSIPLILFLMVLSTSGCRGTQTKTNYPQNTAAFWAVQESATAFPSQTALPPPTLTPTPTAIPTNPPTATATPTPLFVFDLSRFDTDLFQPIEVDHHPVLIARADETVRLAFSLVNTIYCADLERYCQIDPQLFYTYGEAEVFQRIPLTVEPVNGMEPLVARLPAIDQEGHFLRYYAEFSVPEAGYALRYPAAGTIDIFAASKFTKIELPTENPVQANNRYDFFWGIGPDKVRYMQYSPYERKIGPPALDVASDSSTALLDPVNERVIFFNPQQGSYASMPLTVPIPLNGNLAYDQEDRLMVCDFQGIENETSGVLIPQCYLFQADGELEATAPVFAKYPQAMTANHQILDGYDGRLVTPFNNQAEANPRELQRQKQTWELPYQFLETEAGLDPFTARFADPKSGLAYEIHSETGLGVLLGFEKIPQGYLLLFSSGYEVIRAVWIDPAGNILKDSSLTNGHFTELSLSGQVAVARDGSLLVLSSTEVGIAIYYTQAP